MKIIETSLTHENDTKRTYKDYKYAEGLNCDEWTFL